MQCNNLFAKLQVSGDAVLLHNRKAAGGHQRCCSITPCEQPHPQHHRSNAFIGPLVSRKTSRLPWNRKRAHARWQVTFHSIWTCSGISATWSSTNQAPPHAKGVEHGHACSRRLTFGSASLAQIFFLSFGFYWSVAALWTLVFIGVIERLFRM